eukprot:Partr_v1_DN24643_c1_g2_i3_m59874 putative Acetolactate synthase small subunit
MSVVEQARKQLEDLVPVWAVIDYSDVSLIERELLIARMDISPPSTQSSSNNEQSRDRDIKRQAIVELTKLFNGKVVDMTNNVVTVELCAKKRRVDAFLSLMRPYEVLEAVRSGLIALPRTPIEEEVAAAREAVLEAEGDDNRVDLTQLPPG